MKNRAPITIELLENSRLAVTFPYTEEYIAGMRSLPDRKWNRELRRWEVAIGHLPQVLEILRMQMTDVSRSVMRAYQVYKIRHGRVKINAGNVTATLSGVDLPLDKIDRLTSFFIPGYRYMARFKKGTWDGKRHLFHVKHKTFPSGLVPRVAKIIREAGTECEIIWVDEPEPSADAKPKRRTAKSKMTPLRDYQQECLDAALEHQRGVIEIATGGGKTLIAAHIIARLSRPALFLVHTRDLLYQTIDVLERELNQPVGCIGDGNADIKPVTVGTVQSCARALEIKIDTMPDGEKLQPDKQPSQDAAQQISQYIRTVPVAIFDECHHLPAETSYGLAGEMCNAFWRYGLSATPYRADRQDLLMEAALGPKIFSARASALIEMGYLVPPKIRFVSVPPLVVRGGRFDYSEIYTTYVVENRRRNKLIAQAANDLAQQGKSVLVLVAHVRHGLALRDHLNDAPLLQGNDPPALRREIFQALARKECLVAIATTLADEGLDLPSLDSVILASAGKSETRALQRIGRALRPAPGKEFATVIDFMDDAPYLREHASDRLELYKTEASFVLET